jgi:hypothetical protein
MQHTVGDTARKCVHTKQLQIKLVMQKSRSMSWEWSATAKQLAISLHLTTSLETRAQEHSSI